MMCDSPGLTKPHAGEEHPYPGGLLCDAHSPWAMAGLPDPQLSVDPERVYRSEKCRPSFVSTKGGTDINKDRPGGYMSRQRAAKIAAAQAAERARRGST